MADRDRVVNSKHHQRSHHSCYDKAVNSCLTPINLYNRQRTAQWRIRSPHKWKDFEHNHCWTDRHLTLYFILMLPCTIIDFFLNNQPDAPIIQILFCYKTLHVSGIFSAHHQEFSTANSALLSFMQVFDDRFQAESGWNWVPSWLCLEAVIIHLHETYQCRIYNRKLLMMGREDDRNIKNFITE